MMDKGSFLRIAWGGQKPPEGDAPQISKERVFALKDTVSAVKSTIEEAQGLMDIMGIKGGGRVEPQDQVRAIREYIEESQKLAGMLGGNIAGTYYLDQDGNVKKVEAGQPIVINKEAISRTFFVDQEGNVKSLEPGEPIVLKQGQPEQPKSFVVDAEGNVRALEPGEPVVVTKEDKRGAYFVDEEGNVQELQPGQPIVITKEKTAGSYYVDPEGNVKELKPGEPIVVRQVSQQPGKTILIKPDGSTEEVSPGQPIIIERNTAPPEGTLPFEFTDDEGKPLASIRMPLSQFINYQKETARMRQEEEKHQATLGILGEIRKNIPQAVRAIDTFARTRGGGKGEGAELDLPCQHCGRQNRVAPGAPGSESTFVCVECGEENVVTWK